MRDKRIGAAAEKHAAKVYKARLTPASGALRQKSDGEFESGEERFRFENKSTEAKSISLKREWLDKISREALAHEQVPVLTFQFMTSTRPRPYGSWVCLPEYEFRRLLELIDEER